MNILVINAGSSSLKYQLIDMQTEAVLAKGLAERIGIEGSNLKHQPADKEAVYVKQPMKDHIDAIRLVLEALTDSVHGVIQDMSSIHAVGHRVVHGAESFSGSVLIDDAVMQALRENIDIAPLHNPANIMGIEACMKNMPGVPMVGVFDTAFHQTMKPRAFLYGIPYELYQNYRIRRYGFHGTSHKYVSERMAELMQRSIQDLRIVTCHLGNGGSVTAVKGGKSMDTSMGFTPLEGIMMGTRCGDIDPAIIEYLVKQKGMSIDEVMNILQKKSGLQGVSGVGSDMRDVTTAAAGGNTQAQTALEIFAYRIKKYIGAYAAAMGGIDGVVFTAGIGENVSIVRAMVLQDLEWMGIRVDEAKNKERNDEMLISTKDSPTQVWVIATNEELMIARDTLALVHG